MPITESTDKNGVTTVYRGEGSGLPQKDLIAHLRQDRGHSLNAAKAIAKECRLNPQTSASELPTGWHEILHPPKQAFIRRLGFDLFADSRGGGTQYLPATDKERHEALAQIKNGPGTIAAKQCSEAVATTH